MRIFISWSKSPSREVATALRDWLPLVFDNITPWMSDKDIGAGQRGLPEIEGSLQDAGFGIVVITKQNAGNPWINFEAGALSKAMDDREARVAPLLVGYERETDLTGPIAQMQCELLNEKGVRGIVESIAAVLDRPTAVERFDLVWPKLQQELAKVDLTGPKQASPPEHAPPRADDDMLAEILTHVRELRRESSEVGASRQLRRLGWKVEPSASDFLLIQDLTHLARESGIDVADIRLHGGHEVEVTTGGRRLPIRTWTEFTSAAQTRYPTLSFRRAKTRGSTSVDAD